MQQDVSPQIVGDLSKVRGPDRPVDERHAVEEYCRRERTEHEVLECGLPRLDPTWIAGGEHVERDRHDLEAQEDQDEIVGLTHDHCAEGRNEHESVQLRTVGPFTLEPALAHERGDDHRTRHEDRDEGAETVLDDGRVDGHVRTMGGSVHPLGDAGYEARRAGEDRQARRRSRVHPPTQESRGPEDHQCPPEHQQLGKYGEVRDRRDRDVRQTGGVRRLSRQMSRHRTPPPRMPVRSPPDVEARFTMCSNDIAAACDPSVVWPTEAPRA